MSLREDLDAMERHQRNGTLRGWFEGNAPELPPAPYPSDPSAKPISDTYQWIKSRGD